METYLQVISANHRAAQRAKQRDIFRRPMDASDLLIKALGGWNISELPKEASLR